MKWNITRSGRRRSCKAGGGCGGLVVRGLFCCNIGSLLNAGARRWRAFELGKTVLVCRYARALLFFHPRAVSTADECTAHVLVAQESGRTHSSCVACVNATPVAARLKRVLAVPCLQTSPPRSLEVCERRPTAARDTPARPGHAAAAKPPPHKNGTALVARFIDGFEERIQGEVLVARFFEGQARVLPRCL